VPVNKSLTMKVLFLLLSISGFLGSAAQVRTSSFTLYSKNVKDSFVITISQTGASGGPSSAVYYLDAHLKSGNKLRELLSGSGAGQTGNTIFIGIGYQGNNKRRRRRDFIPPHYSSSGIGEFRSEGYGHADRFYNFLTQELIPLVELTHSTNGRRTLIGHSFGGLFVLYSLFQPQRSFQNFIALSPSVWVNRSDIFKYEEAYRQKRSDLDAHLYLSAGRRETMNHVLRTTRRMKSLLDQRKYAGLKIGYQEHKGKGHHSQVPLSLEYILLHTPF
jgi:predicted alpha/beta superfamily hydrolase